MDAGDGIEPPATAYEAVELPLLYPATRDPDETKTPIPLGLEARSGVAVFGHLPLVNSLVGSLAGASIPARLEHFGFVRVPKWWPRPVPPRRLALIKRVF